MTGEVLLVLVLDTEAGLHILDERGKELWLADLTEFHRGARIAVSDVEPHSGSPVFA